MKTSIQFAAIDAFFFMYSVVLFTVALVKRFPLITTWAVGSAISLAGAPVLGMVVTITGCAIVIARSMK